MRKKSKKRKYRLSRYGWRTLLYALLGINVIAAIFWSPLTDLGRVRVTGASERDQAGLIVYFTGLKGRSIMSISKHSIIDHIESFSDVESVSFQSNIFGNLDADISFRKPFAIVQGANLAVDVNGVLYNFVAPAQGSLPSIGINPSLLNPHFALAEPIDLQDLMTSLRLLQLAWPNYDGVLIQNVDGTLCLNRAKKGLINFGTSQDFGQKLVRLKDLLVKYPDYFKMPGTISLVSPTHPTYLPNVIKKLNGS